jgi:hypothetical protein
MRLNRLARDTSELFLVMHRDHGSWLETWHKSSAAILAATIMLPLVGCLDPAGLNQFSGQHISWPPPSFSPPANIGADRYQMTYPYVTDPNYLRLTKALATDRAWRYCNSMGFKRAEVDEPEPERITFACQKPGYRDPANEVVDRNGPVVDEKKLFRDWGAGR